MSNAFVTGVRHRVACAIALTVCLLILLPAFASAHSELDRAEPAPGSTLAEWPTELRLFFSEAPDPSFSSVRVLDDKHQPVDARDSHVDSNDPSSIRVSIPDGVPDGVYTVNWRTVSAMDGHAETGAYTLMVGMSASDMPMSAPMPAQSSDAGFSVATALGRWWFTVAASLVFGSIAAWQIVVFPVLRKQPDSVLRAGSKRARRLALVAACALLLSATYGGVAQAAAAADTPIWTVFGSPLVDLLSRGRYAELWWPRVAFIVVALVLISRRGLDGVPGRLSLLAIALALLTSSLNSHASALPSGAYLAVTMDWLHFVAVAVWLGGLVSLAYVLPSIRPVDIRGQYVTARAVQRFSNLALAAVGVIVVSGVFSAWLDVGSWDALLQTAYGLSLSVKIALLLLTLVFASFNLIVARPGLARAAGRQSAAATAMLRRFFVAIRLEVGLIMLILVAAAVLTGLSPAREQLARNVEDMQMGPIDRPVSASGSNIRVQISPDSPGPNRFAVILPGDIDPRHVERVELTMTYLDADFGEQPLVLAHSPTAANLWESTSPLLSQPGNWQARLLVRQMAKDDLTAKIEFGVPDPSAPMQHESAQAQSDIYPVLPSPGQTLLFVAIGLATLVLGGAFVRWLDSWRRQRQRNASFRTGLVAEVEDQPYSISRR